MNVKFGFFIIAMFFAWPLMGGCPVTVDADVDINAPADVNVNADANAGADTSDAGRESPSDGTGGDSALNDDSQVTNGSDDSGDSPDNNVTPAFTGTYSGQWTRVKRESIGGPLDSEKEWTTNEAVTFDASGLPTALIVPGYGQTQGGVDFVAEVNQVGDSVTLNESSAGYDYTLTVTVALATYGETTTRVVLNLVHHAEGSNEAQTQDGTGVQVIEYSLENGNLVYSSTTTYEVALFHGSIETIWEVTCEGTLSPE